MTSHNAVHVSQPMRRSLHLPRASVTLLREDWPRPPQLALQASLARLQTRRRLNRFVQLFGRDRKGSISVQLIDGRTDRQIAAHEMRSMLAVLEERRARVAVLGRRVQELSDQLADLTAWQAVRRG